LLKSTHNRAAGAAYIALSAVAFGAMAIFGKLAYSQGIALDSLLFLRFAIAAIAMTGWMLITRHPWPRGRSLVGLILMGGIGYVGQAWCYFSSLAYASAGMTALLLYLFPAIVTVLHAVLARRMLTPLRAVAVLMALGGTALTIGGNVHGQTLGIVFGISAALIYAIYIIVGERVTTGIGAIPVATVILIGSAASSALIVFARGFTPPATWTGWGAILAIALISTVVAIAAFFAGLSRLGAPDASTLSTLEPLATILLATFFLGERISNFQILGGTIILCAVIVLARYGGSDTVMHKSPNGSSV
jgi:drug/metabolite transporter (DMT)-like permease